MIRSMTGFGRGSAVAAGVTLTVEIKTVNHRYGDMTVKAPRIFSPLESELRKRVGERLRRGKIDVAVSQEYAGGGSTQPTLNRPLAAAYMQVFREMQQEFGLSGGIPLELLAAQRDVVQLREGESTLVELEPLLDEALTRALETVEAMRLLEGEATCADIVARLAVAEELLVQIESRAPQVPLEWRNKLLERLARYGQDAVADPQRLAQEVALFADRCDVSEELARFRSHLVQMRSLLDSSEAVGRQIDFLVQELNREVNTIGSKSNDAELTRHVVALKAELEKVREQVQNVE